MMIPDVLDERTGSAMLHVRHLAGEIGPRGSTTPQEQLAADYAAAVLERAGLEPRVEPFTSVVSGWRPFAVAALAAIVATFIFLFAGRAVAALLGVVLLVTTLSVFLEMYFRPNLLRPFIAKGNSQNVWARVPAAGTARRRVLLVAHLDTHRTPWVFTSVARLKFFKTMTTLGVVAFVLSAAAFLTFAVADFGWLRYLALVLLPMYVIVLALTWQPDTTPFTAGANDNASGVGALLSLAERLVREPLRATEVWVLASGCEEVGSVGVQAFVKRHGKMLRGEGRQGEGVQGEGVPGAGLRGVEPQGPGRGGEGRTGAGLPAALGISIDNVGGRGAGVCFTSVEGMVIPLRPSRELFALAEELGAEQPELNAYSLPFTTLHTDATCLMANGVASLSFVGLTPAGEIPDWHQTSDVLANVDPSTVAKTEEFVLRLLRRFDERQA